MLVHHDDQVLFELALALLELPPFNRTQGYCD
jgi:hypothetical protein